MRVLQSLGENLVFILTQITNILLLEPHQVEMREPFPSNGVMVVSFQIEAPLYFELVHLYLFRGILLKIKEPVGVSIPSLAINVNILLMLDRFCATLILALFH